MLAAAGAVGDEFVRAANDLLYEMAAINCGDETGLRGEDDFYRCVYDLETRHVRRQIVRRADILVASSVFGLDEIDLYLRR